MKKTVVSIVIMITMVTLASAQKTENDQFPARTHCFHHRHLHDLAWALQFSNQQKEQIKSITSDYHHKMADLNKNENITVKEMRNQRGGLIKAYHSSVQNILTAEQKEKWNELTKKNVEKKKMAAGKKLEKMKTRLNLTEEQTQKIQNLNDQFKDQLKNYQEDLMTGSLDRKEKIRTLRKEHKEELQAILSPDQQKKLNDWKKDKMGRF